MGTIIKIAFRNLKEHKVKSLIVGGLIALGIMLTFIGNSFFEASADGVKKAYSENFTGDATVVIQHKDPAKANKKYNLFGPEDAFGVPDPVPSLPKYDDIYKDIAAMPEVKSLTGMVSGFGLFNFETKGSAFSILFGIDPDSYFKTFDSLNIVEGRMLLAGETGIMISKKRIEQIVKDNKIDPAAMKVGSKVLINSFGKGGFKVRELPVVGIYEYKVPTQALEVVSFVDVQTLRALNNMTTGTAAQVKIDASASALLDDSGSIDDLFGDGGDTGIVKGSAKTATSSTEGLETILGEKAIDTGVKVDTGAWNYILIRVKPDVKPETFLTNLNAQLAAKGYEATALGWKASAGAIAGLTEVVQFIFNIVLGLLAVVCAIIIMNTLVISVMERTSEIGTIRALGGQRSFVRKMFIAETMTLAIVFGVIGMILGTLAVMIMGTIGIKFDNDFARILFGGDVIHPFVSVTQFTLAALLTLGIGTFSWMYPVSVALKVSPLKAIATE